MTIESLYTALNGIAGFSGKVGYYAFPEGQAPKLPFICYHATGSRNFVADSAVFHEQQDIVVELYTEQKSRTIEQKVETVLNAAGIIWERDEDYLDSEQCYMISYNFTI